jgi:hypothetical protein
MIRFLQQAWNLLSTIAVGFMNGEEDIMKEMKANN